MENLMTPEEVAARLGLSVSTIYSLVHLKRLPCLKLSRRALRFQAAEIKAWIQSKAQQAIEPTPLPSPKGAVDGRVRVPQRHLQPWMLWSPGLWGGIGNE